MKRKKVELQWIPSHSGISGNEAANRLAQHELAETLGDSLGIGIYLPRTTTALKTHVIARACDEWISLLRRRGAITKRVARGVGVCSKGTPLIPAGSRTAVTVHRLRCGTGMTSSTMKQLQLKNTDECDTCGVKEDVVHVMEHYAKFAAARLKWIEVCRSKGLGESLSERLSHASGSLYLVEFVVAAGIEV